MRGARTALTLAALLAAGCGGTEAPSDAPPEPGPPVPAQAALSGAHVPTLDPHTLREAEIRAVLEPGPRCVFRYTAAGGPVLAAGPLRHGGEGGVAKLNGSLVALTLARGAAEPAMAFLLADDPVRIEVSPDPPERAQAASAVRRREADMVFEVGDRLRVGYRGFLECAAGAP
jgi:hypothetical protein